MTRQELSRKPVPDQAEDNAFFPSPHSLSLYTSSKTDFDGGSVHETAANGRKILLVGTEERYMLMQNGTMFSTGNHPVETLLPVVHALQAGFKVEVATLTGSPVKLEWWAYPSEDEAIAYAWNTLAGSFKQPRHLKNVLDGIKAGTEDFAAVFIPGGHGSMLGLPDSEDLGGILEWALEADRLVVALCHGPAALLAANRGEEGNLFSGYEICAFPDSIDNGANIELGYIPGIMPWALGEALKSRGFAILNSDITGMVHRDRNLLTGDSPLASNELGKQMVSALI